MGGKTACVLGRDRRKRFPDARAPAAGKGGDARRRARPGQAGAAPGRRRPRGVPAAAPTCAQPAPRPAGTFPGRVQARGGRGARRWPCRAAASARPPASPRRAAARPPADSGPRPGPARLGCPRPAGPAARGSRPLAPEGSGRACAEVASYWLPARGLAGTPERDWPALPLRAELIGGRGAGAGRALGFPSARRGRSGRPAGADLTAGAEGGWAAVPARLGEAGLAAQASVGRRFGRVRQRPLPPRAAAPAGPSAVSGRAAGQRPAAAGTAPASARRPRTMRLPGARPRAGPEVGGVFSAAARAVAAGGRRGRGEGRPQVSARAQVSAGSAVPRARTQSAFPG